MKTRIDREDDEQCSTQPQTGKLTIRANPRREKMAHPTIPSNPNSQTKLSLKMNKN